MLYPVCSLTLRLLTTAIFMLDINIVMEALPSLTHMAFLLLNTGSMSQKMPQYNAPLQLPPYPYSYTGEFPRVQILSG